MEGLLLGAASGFVQYAYGWVQMEGDTVVAKDLSRATELREREQAAHHRRLQMSIGLLRAPGRL